MEERWETESASWPLSALPRRRKAPNKRSVNYLQPSGEETVLDRVLHDLGVIFQPEFREDARPMRRHRLHAQAQFQRDLARRTSRGDETENLKLAVGQMVVSPFLGHQIEGQTLRELGRQKPLAARDLANRRDQ